MIHVYIENWILVFDIKTQILINRQVCSKTKILTQSREAHQFILEKTEEKIDEKTVKRTKLYKYY